jgi:hypothetical protein
MAQDWDIKSRSIACEACSAPFQDNQSYFSCLRFTEAGYLRGDFCAGCWDAKAPEEKAFSNWQGTFHVPPPKPDEPLKKETAETLLRRLVEDADPTQTSVIFILAVMLERKKLLEEKDARLVEGITVRVYEHRKTGETFVVNDPGLRLDQLEKVQQDVVTMLEGGGAPAAPAAADTTEPAAAVSARDGSPEGEPVPA